MFPNSLRAFTIVGCHTNAIQRSVFEIQIYKLYKVGAFAHNHFLQTTTAIYRSGRIVLGVFSYIYNGQLNCILAFSNYTKPSSFL